MRHVALFLFFILLTGIGLVGGWFAARQAGVGTSQAEAPEEPEAEGPKGFDKRTLASLGVKIAPAVLQDFTRFRTVQAVIEERPGSQQPLVAPLGGIVTRVEVEVGTTAKAGTTLIVLSREPIPRPKPDLTADVLTPISEEVHGGVTNVRSALGRLKIVDQNLARIRKHRNGDNTGVRVLRKSEIDLENERARILVDLDSARHELERHGLTAAEVAAVEAGKSAPPNRHLWEHALRHTGLWPAEADAIRNSVPAAQRDLPWCVIAIGELSAAGYATKELTEALKSDPALSSHFGEVAGLLLAGTPLATVRLLARDGALAPEVLVRAPRGPERWDVTEVTVRPGERVEAGAVLARLQDARTMWLRLEPVGAEIALVVDAHARGALLAATPLVRGAAPALANLRLARIAAHEDAQGSSTHAWCTVTNTPLVSAHQDTAGARSWALRAGTRYLAKIPGETLTKRFVLPAGAVARRGSDRLVFVQDGASFRAEPVHLEYEDDEIVVIANDDLIYDGDTVAVSGAFGLMLALQLQAGAGDTAQEHGHAHD